MGLNFKPVIGQKLPQDPPKKPPHILVSKKSLTFRDPRILDSLGNPEWVKLEIDVENSALRLTKVPAGTREARHVMERTDDSRGLSPFIRNDVFGVLKPGIYKPLGGGVFIFDKPKGSSK